MSAMVEVRYRYRLRVSNSQAVLLQAVFDTCRFVWNQTLGRWEDLWRQEQIALRYGAADKESTDWRSRFQWLAEQPSVPQQQVLRDLYQAIAAFFDKNNPSGRPRFKRKGTHTTARWTRRGFTVSGSGLGLAGDRLEVATSVGRIRLRVVVFSCQHCGLVLERDRNSARNLHPDHPRNHRLGCTGAGNDGAKTMVPAGTPAA